MDNDAKCKRDVRFQCCCCYEETHSWQQVFFRQLPVSAIIRYRVSRTVQVFIDVIVLSRASRVACRATTITPEMATIKRAQTRKQQTATTKLPYHSRYMVTR